MRGRNNNGGGGGNNNNNNNRKGPNPLTRSYESNGPDVKIRGTALHIAEKYVQLARDAQASGDRVANMRMTRAPLLKAFPIVDQFHR